MSESLNVHRVFNIKSTPVHLASFHTKIPSFIGCQRLPLSLICCLVIKAWLLTNTIFKMPLNHFLRTAAHFSQYLHAVGLFLPEAEGRFKRENAVHGMWTHRNPMIISSPNWREIPSSFLNGSSWPFEVQLPLLILSWVILLKHLYLSD